MLLKVVARLTVAFAALSTTLNINSTAYLDAAKWGIKFQNLSEPVSIGTTTTTGTAYDYHLVYFVFSNARVGGHEKDQNSLFGLRPVITISKSEL